MALFSDRRRPYQLGYVLYWVAFLLFFFSILSNYWVYDRRGDRPDERVGYRLWDWNFASCLSGHGYIGMRCGPFDQYAIREKMAAACVMVLGTVIQLVACIVLVLYNVKGAPAKQHFWSEVTAGMAAAMSMTGILIYIKFTHFAVNLCYSSGVYIHLSGVLISYFGLLLTGVYNDPPKPVRLGTGGHATL